MDRPQNWVYTPELIFWGRTREEAEKLALDIQFWITNNPQIDDSLTNLVDCLDPEEDPEDEEEPDA